MITRKVMTEIEHIVVSRDSYKQKMAPCQEQCTHNYLLHYMVNKHILGSLFLLLWKITIQSNKKLSNFHFFVHKMTEQSLKLGKCVTNQVVNILDYAWWLSIIYLFTIWVTYSLLRAHYFDPWYISSSPLFGVFLIYPYTQERRQGVTSMSFTMLSRSGLLSLI